MHWDLDEELLFFEDEDMDLATEKINLRSVGIDIGSSTSHLMFSELTLRRRGKEYYGGYTVTDREVIYPSPIILTPYLPDNETIDTDRLREFIQECYEKAGLQRERIDTGAVITTGEAAKKKNARNIIQLFAAETGKFVTAAAGPKLESMLAAHGSGAVRLSMSREHAYKVMNVDIGGGTTKVSVIRNGRIIDTSVINTGARLIAWDESGRMNRIEDAGRRIAEEVGIAVELGQNLHDSQILEISDNIRNKIIRFILQQDDPQMEKYIITEPFKQRHEIGCYVFSGGVSEYIYGREKGQYGDFGKWLGEGLRRWLDAEQMHDHEPLQYIRATVIGASQYTVQVSGNTIHLTDPSLLPLRNLSVVSVTYHDEDEDHVYRHIKNAYAKVDLTEGRIALSVSWQSDPSFDKIQKFVLGLARAFSETFSPGEPLVLLLDKDLAGVIGNAISESMSYPAVVLDLVNLKELDFVDIGEELHNKTVPVTVKSLIFK